MNPTSDDAILRSQAEERIIDVFVWLLTTEPDATLWTSKIDSSVANLTMKA